MVEFVVTDGFKKLRPLKLEVGFVQIGRRAV